MLEVAHEIANDLYEADVIDAVTMREYDALCIPAVHKLSSQEIKQVRLNEKVSQAIFIKYFNTSVSTIRQWEQGIKHPIATSLKLLNIVADKGLEALVV